MPAVRTLDDLMPYLKILDKSIPGNFYCFDLNQKVVHANQHALKAVGANLEDVIGKTLFDFYDIEIAKELSDNQIKIIKNKKVLTVEETIRDLSSGEIKIFEATLAPLFNDDGEIIGTSGTSIEITERKKQEAEIIRQKNQLEKKLQFQRNYLKSYGYSYTDALRKMSDAITEIEHRLMQLDVLEKVRDDLNGEFYTLNEVQSELYTMYQKINSAIISEEENIKNFDQQREIPLHLEQLVESEIGIADASISAEFDVEATFEMDDKSKQKLNVDYKKLQHILRTLLTNYTKAINKDSRKQDIHLNITAKDGTHDKLYVTFNFSGNMPFLELEDNNIRAEHLVYTSQTHIAMDKHNFAYDLALAKHYAELLCNGEKLNDYLFEGSRFSFTLPFRKMGDDGKGIKFKPTIVE